MLNRLGPDWAFLTSDVTEGDLGNNERLAFVYNTSRLRPSGLACVDSLQLPAVRQRVSCRRHPRPRRRGRAHGQRRRRGPLPVPATRCSDVLIAGAVPIARRAEGRHHAHHGESITGDLIEKDW